MTDDDSAVARQMHEAFVRVAADLGFESRAWNELSDSKRRLAVRAIWEALNNRDFLDAALIEVAELDQVETALIRERAIRRGMKATGESHQIVRETFDALSSMDQEYVLSLTEGEPTTLREALKRYVSTLGPNDNGDYLQTLNALLDYPWPAQCEHSCVVSELDQTKTLVTVTWKGDYYQSNERHEVVKEWLERAMEDRSDVAGVRIEQHDKES